MTYRQFVVADDTAILETLGLEPEADDDEVAVRTIRAHDDDGNHIELTYDVPGGSIRCRLTRDGKQLLDIEREAARRLTATFANGVGVIVVRFDAPSLPGELRVQVHPTIAISDQLLRI